MVAYNPVHRSQEAVLEAARDRVGVLIKKALDSGRWVSVPGTSGGSPTDALQFAARHPAVTSVIVGTTNPKHLEANARAQSEPCPGPTAHQ